MSFLARLIPSQLGSPRAAALVRPLIAVHYSANAQNLGGVRSPRHYRRYVSPACTSSCLLLLLLAQALLALALFHAASPAGGPSPLSLLPAALLPQGWATPATKEIVVEDDSVSSDEPGDTSDASDDTSDERESVDEWVRRSDLLRIIDEQLAKLRTRWWYARVPRLVWPLFRHSAARLGIDLAESDDAAIADGTWLVSDRRSAGNGGQEVFRSGFASLNVAFSGDSTISASNDDKKRADLEMAGKLRSMREEAERMDLKTEENYDRAGANLIDLLNSRKEREAQSFFDAWRRANPHEPWPPTSPLSRRLEDWNRRPARAPVTAGNALKSGARMGLLAKLHAQVRGRGGGKGTSSTGTSTSGSAAGTRDPWRRRLRDTDVVIMMLVHNRPAYLRHTLEALSKVDGIQDALLVVSHDGYYPAMHALVRGITFCAVKQIYFPFSPHLFNASFPGASPGDCQGRAQGATGKRGGECTGQADQYGSFRDTKRVSLKHHWWWAMNAVWGGGVAEARGFGGHVVWVEEDHLLFPNALRHLRALLRAKAARCPHCIAANLAPSNVNTVQDDEPGVFKAERMGNVGYAFNRSVWELIRAQAQPFCLYDDYNWDLTLWSSVLRRLPSSWSLRWSRASAHHVGSCGLHSGRVAPATKARAAETLKARAAATIKALLRLPAEFSLLIPAMVPSVRSPLLSHTPFFATLLLSLLFASARLDGVTFTDDSDRVTIEDGGIPNLRSVAGASAEPSGAARRAVVEDEEAREREVRLFIVEEAKQVGAVCLDGSAPGFYYRRGHGRGANKWLLNFRSGAWCTSPWDCYNRSSSLWGSSRHFPDVLPAPGILSAQSDVSPDLYDWNLVIFPYCDGASFSGDRQEPLVFEGAPLFSRGRRILDFLLSHLTARFHMGTAERVLISGCSAGALVVYLHCDYIRHTHIPPSAQVQCLADSGLFLDIPDVSGGRAAQTLFRAVLSIHNVTGSLPSSCLSSRPPEDHYQCFMTAQLLPLLKTPVFVINSNYDLWLLRHALAPPEADPSGALIANCLRKLHTCNQSQLATLQGVRATVTATVTPLLPPTPGGAAAGAGGVQLGAQQQHGVFVFSCLTHCTSHYEDHWLRLTVNNQTLVQAVGNWLTATDSQGSSAGVSQGEFDPALIDCPYPCNSCQVQAGRVPAAPPLLKAEPPQTHGDAPLEAASVGPVKPETAAVQTVV
ncbi:hypothetical protein CLOP_g13889 [Closterium sp. NIES-67]|nr:hypothetical protein CLOP_g4423 [Closterium sp. NIES-67]GJP83777.1 hypothetical protein CLOP_g13889 [Closterium sp. NIES-67]